MIDGRIQVYRISEYHKTYNIRGDVKIKMSCESGTSYTKSIIVCKHPFTWFGLKTIKPFDDRASDAVTPLRAEMMKIDKMLEERFIKRIEGDGFMREMGL